MAEYLSPGVFMEEIPSRFKAIEGVSTSTWGVVGPAQKGTVPGYTPPFGPPVGPALPAWFDLPIDHGPVLVTSFGEFTRAFGAALVQPQAAQNGYLARAVRAFFDNGGKRAYVTRAVHYDPMALGNSATRATLQVSQGTVLRLTRRALAGDTTLHLNSVRGVAVGANVAVHHADGTLIGNLAVAAPLDPRGSTVIVPALASTLEVDDTYVVSAAPPAAAQGPMFHARNPGEWANTLMIDISNYEGPLVPVVAAALGGAVQVSLRSTSSFYRGAVVEVSDTVAGTQQYFEVTDILPGSVLQIGVGLGANLPAGTSFVRVVGINIVLTDTSAPIAITESYRGLTWNPNPGFPESQRRYYANVLNRDSALVYVRPPGVGGLVGGGEAPPALGNQPCTDRGFPMRPTVLGTDNYANITDTDIVGVDLGPGQRSGIASLQDAEDVRIISAPAFTGPVVQNALIDQCENLRYRFALLDGEADPAQPFITAVLTHRSLYDTSFAAYYTPWVREVEAGQEIFDPPSGYIAGICARVDNQRGVWKAPANEVVRDATGLFAYITTGEQDILNPRGVNCIRRFEERGIRVWGGRTLSSDPEYRYVNVRRYLIFLEASLDRGTQWVVFEPNSPETWSRVTDSVSAFLNTQWRSGALFGRRPEDAYFVRCDETTMTADDVQNGRLICEIGVAIVRPAEFVIFRIEQITGFAKTT
jgi:phage tail sheath protein FI